MLQLIAVSKSYGKRQVLNNLTFTFEAQKLYLIFGPSGSGKSTLLNLVTGLDLPDKGEVSFKSENINQLSEDKLAVIRANNFGIVFQFFNFLNSLSIKKNILLPSYLVGPANTDNALKLMKTLGIDQLADSFPHQVSGGELQRAAIARALINNPDIIIADEPTGNLDTENSYQVMTILKKLAVEEKKTVIVVTHNQELISFADQIVHLKDYQLQA